MPNLVEKYDAKRCDKSNQIKSLYKIIFYQIEKNFMQFHYN